MEPSKETIEGIRTKFPGRSLHLVEAQDEGASDVEHFIMTGSTRDEYKKFCDETAKAEGVKDPAEQLQVLRAAIERAAMAQIRWPDRQTVQELFDRAPAMVDGFAKHLHHHAGTNYEVRSKKL